MAKRGTCHLCGKVTDRLSKDHMPPQCAFNEKDRTFVRMESVIGMPIEENHAVASPKVRNIYHEIQPDRPIAGGIYRYTQCEECNGLLGRCYDARFARWCHDAVHQLKPGEIVVVQREYTQRCYFPLSILKRVVAMFFSINGDRFAGCQPELSAFVRHHDRRELPKRFRFFAAYNVNDLVSHIPYQTRADVIACRESRMSQIAHPPFVYVMTIDSPTPDARLAEITGFSRFAYDDEAGLDVQLQVVPTNSCLAGDFRASGKLVADDEIVFPSPIAPSYFRILDTVI